MATNQAMRTVTLDAGADLSTHQFKLMKLSAVDRRVIVCAAVTDTPIGVLQNKPTAAGQQAIIALLDGAILKIVVGESFTTGALVGLHTTDGTVGAPGDAGELDVGVAVEDAATAGDIVEILTQVMRAHA